MKFLFHQFLIKYLILPFSNCNNSDRTDFLGNYVNNMNRYEIYDCKKTNFDLPYISISIVKLVPSFSYMLLLNFWTSENF